MPSLRYDGRPSRGTRSGRTGLRIGRTGNRIDPPRARSLPGRRIRARTRCGFRFRLLGTVLGSSGRSDVAGGGGRTRNEVENAARVCVRKGGGGEEIDTMD